MAARGHAQAAVGVMDCERQADVDPAERVDDLDETEEVDLDVVIDDQPGGLLDGPDHQSRPAEPEGGVDLVHAVAGNVDPGVPRQAETATWSWLAGTCTTLNVTVF